MSALTARELLVLRMVVRGCGYKSVANKLNVTARTIEHSIRGIKKKLGAESLAQLGWLARDVLEPGRIKDNNFVHSWHLLTPYVQDLISQLVTEFDMAGMRSQHLINKIKQLQSEQLTKEKLMAKKVKKPKGHGSKPGKRSLTCDRKSSNRMIVKMNINTETDHVQAKFDYDFEDTDLLDLINERVEEGIIALNPHGEVTSDEALDFFQGALMAMSAGTAATRAEVEEEA